jgi:hypothetical protein
MGTVGKDYFIERIILHLSKKIKHCCGLDMLCILVEHPDADIDVTKLRHLDAPASIHAKEFDVCAEALPGGISTDHCIPELPIPYTDKQTINQVKKAWLMYLSLEREAQCNNDYAKADDYREEREKYQDYLSTVVTQKGKIRNLKNQRHDDYVIIRNNFNRFLRKVQAINPEYADFIQAHLVIGYTCMWRTR